MSLGDRIRDSIYDWAQSWSDQFIEWLAKIGRSLWQFTFGRVEEILREALEAQLRSIEEAGPVPPEIREAIDRIRSPASPIPILIIVALIFAVVGPVIAVIKSGALTKLRHAVNKAVPVEIADPAVLIRAYWREEISSGELSELLSRHGFDSSQQRYLTTSLRAQVTPAELASYWFRQKLDKGGFLKYMDRLGFHPSDAEIFWTQAHVYPTPRDIVDFLAHEVFEPDMVSKYSLDSEWGKIDKEFAQKIGLMPEILQMYWRDHWKHPEWGTIQELRHRDKITDQDVKDWFRLVEIPEYWRNPMLEVMWGLPNRIEIRMMARYLDMSKSEIEDLLKKAGLHEDFRSDAADFMMIMGLTGYWADMLSNAWMTPEQVRADIESRNFKPVTADRIYKRLVSATKGARVDDAKTLTKTEIYKGVKKGIVSWEEGVDLLIDIGYDRDEADYILAVNVGALAGSPETLDEFKEWTIKYRRATGAGEITPEDEFRSAGGELIRLTRQVEELRRQEAEELATIMPEALEEFGPTAKLTEIRVTLNRTLADLQKAQQRYNDTKTRLKQQP